MLMDICYPTQEGGQLWRKQPLFDKKISLVVTLLFTFLRYSATGYDVWVNYFSSPTYNIYGVKAGTSQIDCRKAHLESMNAISRIGDESDPPCGRNQEGESQRQSTSTYQLTAHWLTF